LEVIMESWRDKVDIPCGEAIWRRTDPKTRWREAKRERERE
jgi:hypothetical protein